MRARSPDDSLIALVLVSTLMVAGVAAVNRGINDRLESVRKIDLVLQPAPPEGANYVILGSDTRAGAAASDGVGDASTITGQRSDTLMVAHVEPKAQKTFVVSFPRDLIVDIPGFGKRRINEAYNLGGGGAGGAQLVIQTLEANFPGLKLHHYVQVDFQSFREVVDAIGAVKVYFPLNTRDFDRNQVGDTGFEQKAGCAALNGDRALDYVRSRHLEEQDPNTQVWKSIDIVPDIARIGRQQTFIRNLAGVAIEQSLSDPFAALDIADRVQSFLGIDSTLRARRAQPARARVPHHRRQRQQRARVRDDPVEAEPRRAPRDPRPRPGARERDGEAARDVR